MYTILRYNDLIYFQDPPPTPTPHPHGVWQKCVILPLSCAVIVIFNNNFDIH